MSEPKLPATRNPLVCKGIFTQGELGIVLSGGGSRAAYQIGVLRALIPYLSRSPQGIRVIVGSSMGAVNGILLAACLKVGLQDAVDQIAGIWCERTFRNTFRGSPSRTFLNAVKIAILRYSSPGPVSTSHSIFDPTPLVQRLDEILDRHGGLELTSRDPQLQAVGIMTTLEGAARKPLLFVSTQMGEEIRDQFRGAHFEVVLVDRLTAKHGLASAALPSVLPPVELDIEGGKVRLVDGGISENIPVDPAVRLGANQVVVIDISGRSWWHDRYGKPHDSRPPWEVPAGNATYCLRPPQTLTIKPPSGLGQLLKEAVSGSRRDFIEALGPTWPIFSILRRKMGEDLAYEVMSYVALHRKYFEALLEKGYEETKAFLAMCSLEPDSPATSSQTR